MLIESEAKPNSLRPLYIMVTMVLALWVLTLFLLPLVFDSTAEAGQTGDMFGTVNSLFSGLTLSGLVMTILMQRRQIVLQSDELALTRREFALQRFEGTLFGLIRQLNDHKMMIRVEEWSVSGDSSLGLKRVEHTGQMAIRYYAARLPEQFFDVQGKYDANAGRYEVARTEDSFEAQTEKYRVYFEQTLEEDIAPYMRLLYGIFRHIDVSKLDEDRKKMYSRIARAGLSSAELKIIFFDCASGPGVDFRYWIEKYGLLKHLPSKVRLENSNLAAEYNESAFEPQPIPHTAM